MGTIRKKRESEEMLVIHKPAKMQEKSKVGREAATKGLNDTRVLEDLEEFRRRLISTTDPNERESLLNMIRRQFGNEAVEGIIRELRDSGEREDAAPT